MYAIVVRFAVSIALQSMVMIIKSLHTNSCLKCMEYDEHFVNYYLVHLCHLKYCTLINLENFSIVLKTLARFLGVPNCPYCE